MKMKILGCLFAILTSQMALSHGEGLRRISPRNYEARILEADAASEDAQGSGACEASLAAGIIVASIFGFLLFGSIGICYMMDNSRAA